MCSMSNPRSTNEKCLSTLKFSVIYSMFHWHEVHWLRHNSIWCHKCHCFIVMWTSGQMFWKNSGYPYRYHASKIYKSNGKFCFLSFQFQLRQFHNMISGFTFHFAIQILLLLWVPHPDQSYLLYIISGTWGFAEAILQTLINGTQPRALSSNYILKRKKILIMTLEVFEITTIKIMI